MSIILDFLNIVKILSYFFSIIFFFFPENSHSCHLIPSYKVFISTFVGVLVQALLASWLSRATVEVVLQWTTVKNHQPNLMSVPWVNYLLAASKGCAAENLSQVFCIWKGTITWKSKSNTLLHLLLKCNSQIKSGQIKEIINGKMHTSSHILSIIFMEITD